MIGARFNGRRVEVNNLTVAPARERPAFEWPYSADGKAMAMSLCPEADMCLFIDDVTLIDLEAGDWSIFRDAILYRVAGAWAESHGGAHRWIVWKMPNDPAHRAEITAAMEPIVRAIDARRRPIQPR